MNPAVALDAKRNVPRRRPSLFMLVAGAGALFLLVYAVGLMVLPEPYLVYQSGLAYQVPGLVALALVVRALWRSRGRERAGLAALAALLVAWQAGDWTYTYIDLVLGADPFPSVSDIFYYVGYGAFIVAIALLTGQRRPLGGAHWLMDIGIVVVVAATLKWTYIIDPMLREGGYAAFPAAVALGYPLLDLALFALIVVATCAGGCRLSTRAGLLAASALLLVAFDSAYSYLVSTNGYDTVGNYLELGWLAVYVLIGLAAVSPAGVWEDEEFAGPSGLAPLALPYVAVLPLVGLTLYKIGHGEASMALVAGATASGLLLLARQFFTLVENRRLYRELEREGSLLAHAATHDDLTGALNRRGFDVVLQDTLSRVRGQRSAAVLYIDLDDFKAINDSLGHPAGDAFLVSHGALLNQVVRPGDALARLGGDEFAVLLHDVDEDEAVATAQRLLQALRRHTVELYGRHVKTTASIGIALAPAHGTTVEGLLAHADAAMYEAKERGRNRIAVYDASGSTEILSESRLEWRRSIDEALQYDRFRLYAQPVVDLRTRRVSAYEVLIRMQRDDGELVLPEAFLGIAERFGMIDDIDRWVLAHACAVLSERQAAGLPVLLSVNVSTRTLLHAGLHSFLAEQIQRSGADPRQLIIEITETMAVDDVEGMLRQMNEIRELGIRFALDDFGAGYSSFSHLRRLPVDYLKIDGSFVQRLGSDGNDRAIVGAIAQLAQSLGRETVAEFVEDEATALELERLGIRYGQGYYLGEPAPIEEALQRAAAEQAAA